MSEQRHPAIEEAIDRVAEDLAGEGWGLGDDGDLQPQDDCLFKSSLRRHFAFAVDKDGWREARIASLKAELTELEGSLSPTSEP